METTNLETADGQPKFNKPATHAENMKNVWIAVEPSCAPMAKGMYILDVAISATSSSAETEFQDREISSGTRSLIAQTADERINGQ